MRYIYKQVLIKNFYNNIFLNNNFFFFNFVYCKKFSNFINRYYILGNFYYLTFSKIKFFFFINLLLNFIESTKFVLNFYCNKFYKFYKFFTFAGLGFKKRWSPFWIKNRFFVYFGDRHWIIFLIPSNLIFFHLIKRKSIVLFSMTKNLLKFFLSNFKLFCKENLFKLKGVLDVRLKKRWVFMRRIKIRGLKIKLSKKQKIL